MEHKICEDCKWNKYPLCMGIKMEDYMNIENLNDDFQCGQKDLDNMMDFSIREKTKLELLEERVETLESGTSRKVE